MIESTAQIQDGNLKSVAWMLALGNGLRAAVSEIEMQHLLSAPRLFEIPGSPFHCRHVCIWNSRLLPIMDLKAWLMGYAGPQDKPLVAVVGYQSCPGVSVGSAHALHTRVQLGGLLLRRIPTRVLVSDDRACELPDSDVDWRDISISCFSDEGNDAVPILDLSRIFSDALIPVFS
jgi:chemotaxis signal transduction protein